MAGFYVNNFNHPIEQKILTNSAYVSESFLFNEYFVSRCTLDKFLDDKIFYHDQDTIVLLEGVVFNKSSFSSEIQWEQLVRDSFESYGINFIRELRGQFAGAVYQKAQNRWVFYTNQTGDKMLYYYYEDGNFIVSSSFQEVLLTLIERKIPISVDSPAVYDILINGFLTSDRTLVSEIKRLEAGHYIVIDDKGFSLKQYHAFKITSNNHHLSEEEIVDELDRLFRKAVVQEFEKDREYGYRHICCLSGGLDSRLTIWAASELGYAHDIVAIEFGMGDYLDEKYAKRVAKELGVELIIKPLDDARFLLDYKDTVKMNNGLSLYYGTAHGNSMYRLINFSEFGLMHTGDEQVFWSHFFDQDYADTIDKRLLNSYSKMLQSRYHISGRTFDHIWEFYMYSRGFLGNLNSTNAKNDYILHSTPFLDVDFIEFVYSLPLSLLKGDAIYTKWYLTKYPKACDIPFERYKGAKIGDSSFTKKIYRARNIGPSGIFHWLKNKVGLKSGGYYTLKNDMNPLDVWYNEKEEISRKMDSDFADMKQNIVASKIITQEMASDIEELYSKGRVSEKTQALTIVTALNMFFLGDN